ncbi:MAG: NTP transferase domain-containing protein [Pseudomonadota bacterium]|nr:NTP transferase domain-containing protein [Pseudomonadota bacterium]
MLNQTIEKDLKIKILLLCGGEGNRWGNHMGVPKQLVPINKKPLLEDTINKLRAKGHSEISIIGCDNKHIIPGVSYVNLNIEEQNFRHHKFLSSRNFWNTNGTTLILFGDVFFSDFAIDVLLSFTSNSINFTGRLTASRVTGCEYQEIFGVSFNSTHNDEVELLMLEADIKSSRPAGWQFYKAAANKYAIGESVSFSGVVFNHIDDFTEDFDFPYDYEKWKKNLEIKKVQADADQFLNVAQWMRRAKKRKVKVVFLSFCNLFLILIIGFLLT